MKLKTLLAVLVLLGTSFAADVTITWDDFINPTGTCYNTYGSGTLTGPKHKMNSAPVCDYTFTQTKVRPGSYVFWVTAVDVNGVESAYSAAATLVIP